MGHRKKFPPESRPLIIRNGTRLSFISRDREWEFTGGAAFRFQQKVHADDRNDNSTYRFIGDDGQCNDCGNWCVTLRLDGLDNTKCRLSRPSVPSFGLRGRVTAASKKQRAQLRVPKPANYDEIYHKEMLGSFADKPELAQPFAHIVMLVLLLRAESKMFPSLLEAAGLQERRAETLDQAATILNVDLPLTLDKVEPTFARVLEIFELEFRKKHPIVARLKTLIEEARGSIQRLGQVNL